MPMAVARRPSGLDAARRPAIAQTSKPRSLGEGLDFQQLCEVLATPALAEVNLAGFYMGSKLPVLARVLQQNGSVTACDLSDNALGDHGAELVARVLEDNPVRTLRLGGNGIGRSGCLALNIALRRSELLCHLDLSNNGFGEECVCELVKCFRQHPSLAELDLGYNAVHVEGAVALAELLAAGVPPLRAICLPYCEVLAEGVEALAQALTCTAQGNTTLTRLDLSGNHCQDRGAERIAEMLLGNRTLRELRIPDNDIRARGGERIGAALRRNSALEDLDLSRNGQLWGDGRALGSGLAQNAGLTCLGLAAVGIYRNKAEPLAELLEGNCKLERLDLSMNSIGASGSHRLAAALEVNDALTTLDLTFNSLGDAGAGALARAITTNRILTSLSLRDNRIGEAGALQLHTALEVCSNIRSLDLRQNRIPAKLAEGIDTLIANAGVRAFTLEGPSPGGDQSAVQLAAGKGTGPAASLGSSGPRASGGYPGLAKKQSPGGFLPEVVEQQRAGGPPREPGPRAAPARGPLARALWTVSPY